ARIDGPLGVGIVEDAVVDVVRVAREFLARGHVARSVIGVFGRCGCLHRGWVGNDVIPQLTTTPSRSDRSRSRPTASLPARRGRSRRADGTGPGADSR